MLKETFRKIINFLENEKINYLVIGGIASSLLGEPRFTEDIDICIFIEKDKIQQILEKFAKEGFTFDVERQTKRAKLFGTFAIKYDEVRIDFIIASTDFEKEAFNRRQRIEIFGVEANFPSPEDLILFKVVAGRKQDMADAEKIMIRWKEKIDKEYLIKWAEKFSDMAQDMRIYNEIKKLLEV